MLENLKKEKEELVKKFNGQLPSYLKDFFDEKELEEIKENITEEEFWSKNKAKIVKRKKRTYGNTEFKYKSPPRAEERLLEETDPKIIVAACEKRLDAFAVSYFPHYLKKPNSKFHEFLYKTLAESLEESNDTKWAVAAPRSNSKSSIVSAIFPIWCICYNKRKFIVLLSDTVGQAEDFLSDIKQELEVNEALQRDFPFACGKGSIWRADEIITRNGVKIKALGTGSRVRGRKFGIHRPSLLIGDDIESSEMVRSKTQRKFIREEWFDKDVLFAGGEKGANTNFFVIGTILGKDSLLNTLLNPGEYPDWKSKKFKAVLEFSKSSLWDEWAEIYKNRFDEDRELNAIKFFEEHKEEMLEGTKVLWPEGDPYYDLMVAKLRSFSSFNCFDKDTDVVLWNGNLKKISGLSVGNEILSGNGTKQYIKDIGTSNLYNRKVYDIKIVGHKDKIRVTEDHPFYIYPRIKYRNVYVTHQHLGKVTTESGNLSTECDRRILENRLKFVEAKDLKVGDATIFPILEASKTCKEHNPQAWIYKNLQYSKIQSISEVKVDNDYKTWWISVTGNKTYCVPNAIVHNSEKQNNPIDPTKVLVTRESLHWEDFSKGEHKLGIQRAFHFGFLDPSVGKRADRGDRSAIVTLARDPKTGYIYVEDINVKRRTIEKQVMRILKLHELYRYKKFGVETNAFQYVVAEKLRKESMKQNIYIPVMEKNQYQDKKLRFEGCAPFLLDGTIIFDINKDKTDQMYNYGVEQLCTFTGEMSESEDDVIDALVGCFEIAKAPRFKMLTKQR